MSDAEGVQDILDLCRLNLMEEEIEGVTETCIASSVEVQSFKDAIKFGKRRVVNRIISSKEIA